ncbi:MAG: ferredoxin [Bacteroidetes bacterium GWA2_31_9]|nr:MAG: ferredoxin [Bacteroidetes bacterium GWA2_31_9]
MGLTYLKNVVTLELNQDKCSGCSMCVIVCPHGVFELKNKKSQIVEKDLCMECGACAKNCPDEAITVKSGVGCSAGIIMGFINGTEPTCGCDGDIGCC